MEQILVIVESPAKARTINKILGSGYLLKSSVGHVKDLPKKELGVDVDNDFEPKYVVIKGKQKVVAEIKAAAKGTKKIYLAPDPDREGEAIAWHIATELSGKSKNSTKIYRVTFNEITKDAVLRAIEAPREIDMNKVQAQQTRRILDRLVGYKISPLLWRKVKTGLSAGRVQSVTLRLICEREREIQAFVAKEYWSIIAQLRGKEKPDFEAKLLKIDKDDFDVSKGEEAEKHVEEIKKQDFIVSSVVEKQKLRNPVPPFITSTIQQEASRYFNFSSKRTMMIAQMLYEGINLGPQGTMGLITYMRTDSVRIAGEALNAGREFIKEKFGSKYLPSSPRSYKSAKSAQEAHEAIRPTMPALMPEEIKEHLTPDQFKLYDLIWKRFIASQMKPAIYNTLKVDIKAGKYLFRATGATLIFDGFLKVYEEKTDDEDENQNGDRKDKGSEPKLPRLSKGDKLKLLKLTPNQHFTKPPPRYTEATLVRELEKKGIGRPSTYAMIMSRILDKSYTIKQKKQFFPTDLGMLITDMLVESFPDIINVQFTAEMEDKLDQVESGKLDWTQTLRQFYEPFARDLAQAEKEMRTKTEPTDVKCKECEAMMLKRWGKNGFFLGCEKYPECKHTQNLTDEDTPETDEKCEKCGSEMVVRRGKYGPFLACSGYPECKNVKSLNKSHSAKKDKRSDNSQAVDEQCPDCGKPMVARFSRYGKFMACSGYPECKYIKRNKNKNKSE